MNERRVTRLDELARDVPPARDLWPAISAAIAESTAAEQAGTVATTASRRSFWRPTSALAAAAALVAFGVFLGMQFGNRPVVMPLASATSDPAVVPASLQRDAAYRQQRDELFKQVEVRLNAMSPAERDKVAGSLATLRRSINEIEAALGRDPANVLLQELLVSSCQEEMRALTAVRDSGNQET